MRNYLSLLVCLLVVLPALGQSTVKMSAVKANDYGVSYSLPKTTIAIDIKYTKVERKVGDFYKYAERYLNISNPIIENETTYALDEVQARTVGVVDKSKSYLLELKAKTVASFLTLTNDGLLCAINADYVFPAIPASKMTLATEPRVEINPHTLLSEEILRAGSTAKQAELIAKQIYRLRESRTNILTGEADNMPPDGDAYKLVMKQLDEQEQVLTSMFIGVEYKETASKSFTVVPEAVSIDEKVVFRFSTKLGVVKANDLAGEPVYLTLTNKQPQVVPVLTEKEQKDLEKKFSEGVIYNVPSKGQLTISYRGKQLVDAEYDIVQFGKQEVLTPRMFENNKQAMQVLFYPELGSVKQILQ